jgi:prophage antirepressor-like protein
MSITQQNVPNFGNTTFFINDSGKIAFLAKEIIKKLEVKNVTQAITNANLIEGVDYVIISKKEHPKFINDVCMLNIVTSKTHSVMLLFESGLNLLILNSRKEVGKLMRRWLVDEVLPQIKSTGKYESKQSAKLEIKRVEELKDTTEQKTETKLVHKKIWDKDRKFYDIINHERKNHLMVHGRTVAQLKEQYSEKKGGKEILRKYEPECAVAMAYNDYLIEKYNCSLEQLSNVPEIIKKLYNEFDKLGFEIVVEK